MTKKNEIKPNYSKIGRQFNCDYRTVKAYYERDETKPLIRKKRIIKKITDGFEEIIKDKYINDGAPAIAIFKLIKNKYGYKGSYSTIKKFTHELGEEKTKEATVRFETSKGLQCQIDWKESLNLYNKNDELFTINILLGILGYSRLKYIELTYDRSQPTLFKCLYNMFKYFNGVPQELLFDNMKTVVDRSKTQFQKATINEKFYSFSKDTGFIVRTCLPYSPETKGKVETVARIMNRLKVYNHEFETLDELITIVKNLNIEINNEIHSVTREKPIDRFQKEKEYLNPLPNDDAILGYFQTVPLARKVSKDSLITYKENKYSVPEKYIGKTVNLVTKDNSLQIYYNENFICRHNISSKPINYLEEHYKALLKHTIKDEKSIDEICKANLKLYDKF